MAHVSVISAHNSKSWWLPVASYDRKQVSPVPSKPVYTVASVILLPFPSARALHVTSTTYNKLRVKKQLINETAAPANVLRGETPLLTYTNTTTSNFICSSFGLLLEFEMIISRVPLRLKRTGVAYLVLERDGGFEKSFGWEGGIGSRWIWGVKQIETFVVAFFVITFL